MTVLFDERDMVKPILDDGFSNGRTNKYELILLAKHYRWNLGYGTQRIKKAIIDFCKEHDKNFNPVIARDFLKDVIRIAENNSFRTPVPVQITDREIQKIKEVKNFEAQKLLFVLLVSAKTLKFMNSDMSGKSSHRKPLGYYIHLGSLNRIKKEAGLSRISSDNTMMTYLHDFYNLGLIMPTFRNSIQILYGDDNGIPVIFVNDFSNIAQYYIDYVGGELLYCSECKKEFKKYGNKKDLCPECNAEKIREQTRLRVARYREKQN